MIELIGEDQFNNKIFYSNIKDDEFIHFTQPERASQILKDGKLLINPPYEKFGGSSINAISVVFGKSLPGVQTTHIESESIVAIIFKTNSIPKVGFVEEVSWDKDVNLINPKIISKEKAISILNNTPQTLEDDGSYVLYDKNEAKKWVHTKTENKIARILYIAESLQSESKGAK